MKLHLKQKDKRIFVFSAIILVLLGIFFFFCPFRQNYSDEKRIQMGIKAISNMVKEDGSIVYNIDFLKNTKSKKNNIVREMGTAYALAFAYNQTKDKNIQKKLVKIFNKTKERCIPIGRDICMISDNPKEIKLGATALGLLAELFYEKTSHDFQFSELREKWVNAITNLYIEGKGLRISHYKMETSPYFDGEGWFALAVYHDMYPENENVKKVLDSLDKTIFKIYQDNYLISFIHWGLMASAQRYGTTLFEFYEKTI